jgi:hypothetical protein
MRRLFILLTLMIPSATLLAKDFPDYGEYVMGEIEFNRKLKIEEKKIEVLARLQQLGASNISVGSSSTASSYSKAKNKTVSDYSISSSSSAK